MERKETNRDVEDKEGVGDVAGVGNFLHLADTIEVRVCHSFVAQIRPFCHSPVLVLFVVADTVEALTLFALASNSRRRHAVSLAGRKKKGKEGEEKSKSQTSSQTLDDVGQHKGEETRELEEEDKDRNDASFAHLVGALVSFHRLSSRPFCLFHGLSRRGCREGVVGCVLESGAWGR